VPRPAANQPAQPRDGDGPPPQVRPPDAPNAAPRAVGPPLPTVSLASLVEHVEKSSKKSFLIDSHVPQQVYLGSARAEDVTYPLLLSILRTNSMAAVTIEGRVNIVPDFQVRFYPLPIVDTDQPNIAADEWVTRIITLSNIDAPSIVPILRPLLPQAAHLAAMPPKKLVVVDRYANVQRITAIVKALDK
jgi:general secretion pathway protein D